MRRLATLLVLMMVCVATSYAAGGVMVVDSEKIFKSLDEYNAALSEVDRLSEEYQKQVDEKFAKVEQLFNDYSASRASMSTSQRSDREALILIQEKMATEFQEQHFSKDGTIMKRRVELIAPIQERVFGAIEKFAADGGYDVVIDKSANASLLYSRPGADQTDEIIEILK